jgi:hypothetical protein
MQALDSVTFHPDTSIGWNAVPPEEKDYILTTMQALAAQPPEQWPREVARHLPTPEPLYILHAHNGLLVIFRRNEEGAITVVDLMHRETVERYFLPKQTNGAQA